ncbi:integrase core domain-containing protein [Burkholderia sp. BE12]|uniref:integrase core domain-containing protein n=1 Tax=Burkholderia sp. BE12 TaxID=2082394 RepID=UPI003FA3BE2D
MFIHPSKPVENAYIESFNGRFRDECLNKHWFVPVGKLSEIGAPRTHPTNPA